MSRLRLLFFWLLVLAVPLQGLAATTKLLCSGAEAAARHHLHGAVTEGGHAHAHQVDASDHVPPHGHAGTGTFASSGLDAPGHQCGLCAACCHAIGLSPAEQMLAVLVAPKVAAALEPVARVPDRTLSIPDKPPRA